MRSKDGKVHVDQTLATRTAKALRDREPALAGLLVADYPLIE